MLVAEIIKDIDCKIIQGNTENVNIENISRNSKNIKGGELFFCIKGNNFDTHELIDELVEKGVKALVVERDVTVKNKDVLVIKVDNTRRKMGLFAANFYSNPAKKMKIIGVIGTKGKSTTAGMIKEILCKSGHKAGLIGSIAVYDGMKEVPSALTTPEADDLHRLFYDMYNNGCEYVVMEASSQSYLMGRTEGIVFDIAIFTNITPDHIGKGEHKDFDDYFNCKKNLLRAAKVIIYNGDDELSEKMIEGLEADKFEFSLEKESEFCAKNVKLANFDNHFGVEFTVEGREYKLIVPGKFNVYNAMAAIRTAYLCEIPYEKVYEALKDFQIAGRMEGIASKEGFLVLIDFAHNATALENVLRSLKQYEHNRIVCMFGCGGNRSRLRRLEMGEVSGKMADFTIITSDNPRFEEPAAIIADIVEGISKTDGEYIKIEDRREAIAYAVDHAQKGDVIVLAGKGHERDQEIKGEKFEMDERKIVAECLKARESKNLVKEI